MYSISWIITISLIVIIALIGDLFLMGWFKKVINKNAQSNEINKDGVFLFGVYSPVLTWLSQWLKFLPKGRETPINLEIEKTSEIPEIIETPQPTKRNDWIAVVSWLERQGAWLEIAILIVGVFFYCIGILDLGTTSQLPGNESGLFQSIDWLLYHALKDFHQFPLWNPYIHTGIPYIADPMLHIYNPVVTIPSLLWGVRAGFKIGVVLSFLLAAMGMWCLGKTLRMGKIPSLWIGLMYTFAGQPVARFFQGEYLFVLGFAWIPWIIVNLYSYARTRKKKYFGFSALTIAGLYFCGNAYYPFLIAFVIIIFILAMALTLQSQKPYINLDKKLFVSMVLIACLSFGMIAIHFYPQIQLWPRLNKGDDIQGSHTLKQIWLDYTSKDTYRPDAYDALPAREEFYAYIGYIPFIALIFLPFAFKNKDKRFLLFLFLVLLFVYLWIDVNHMPWRKFFYTTHILSQFRHVLRPLILGSFGLFVLGGLGIDMLWKYLREFEQNNQEFLHIKWCVIAATLGMGLLIVIMSAGILDEFYTNGQYIKTDEDYPPAYQVMRWVRQNDNSEFYVRNNPTNSWMIPALTSNLRYIDVWYPFSDIRVFDGQINHRTVSARPLYIVQNPSEKPPTDDGAYIINHVEGYDIYQLPESLPMAFTVEYSTLLVDGADELKRKDVSPLTPFFSGTNAVEIIAQGELGDELILLVTNYPGWKVTIDGRPATMENAGGYLATRMQSGVHQYRFVFIPIPFYIGLVISLICLGIGIYLIVADYQLSRRRLVEKWQGLSAWFEKLRRIRWIPETQNHAIVGGMYGNGVFQPEQPVKIVDQSHVRLLVVADRETESLTHLAWRHWTLASRGLAQATFQALSLAGILFIFTLGVYLTTRLIGLSKFPIYFFTDEAIQTLSAVDLVRDGFRDPNGQLLPTYFQNSSYYNLSLSVYLQVLPYLLFGKSIMVTRGVSVFVSILAAVSIAWMLKDIFKLSLWWLGPALLAVVPAWFLHSRTAFETVIFVSFYAALLYSYLLYRYRSPKYIYLTLTMAALAFYSYSPGQVIVAFTGLLLLFSDLGYHWKNRRVIPAAAALFVFLALPYIRFRITHGDVATEHLKLLASYWIQPIPLNEKIHQFVSQYLYGLSPGYWFIPNQHDLDRHLMKGYGLISLYWLPFVIAGIGVCIWQIRSSMHRLLLITMLAAPIGGALVGIGITRVLVMVIPATLLMALGLEYCFKWVGLFVVWLKKKYNQIRQFENWHVPASLLPLALFILFSLSGFSMMKDALINGPTWYRDYGLGGLQFGAPQIFYAINDYLEDHPDAKIILSPSWTNGADIVARFFITDDQPVKMGSIDSFLFQHLSLDDRTVFVMIPEEYDKAVASGKFASINVDKTVLYPDGRTGFYFTRVNYIGSIDQILTSEQEIRRQLKEADVTWLGQTVHVRYSPLDMGEIVYIFDGNRDTLVRTAESNPAIYEIKFSSPVQISSLSMMFGSTEARVVLTLYPTGGGSPVKIDTMLYGSVDKPDGVVKLSKTYTIDSLQLKLTDTRQSEPGNVHLWDIAIP